MKASMGQKIRSLRQEKNLTLDQLAERTGSSKSYIWELENKNPPRPSANKLAKIAGQLDVTLEYLFDDNKVSKEDAIDVQFFREYQGLDNKTKGKIREMVKLWGRE